MSDQPMKNSEGRVQPSNAGCMHATGAKFTHFDGPSRRFP